MIEFDPTRLDLAREYHNNVARLTTNVLRRFADPTPFPMPAARR